MWDGHQQLEGSLQHEHRIAACAYTSCVLDELCCRGHAGAAHSDSRESCVNPCNFLAALTCPEGAAYIMAFYHLSHKIVNPVSCYDENLSHSEAVFRGLHRDS